MDYTSYQKFPMQQYTMKRQKKQGGTGGNVYMYLPNGWICVKKEENQSALRRDMYKEKPI